MIIGITVKLTNPIKTTLPKSGFSTFCFANRTTKTISKRTKIVYFAVIAIERAVKKPLKRKFIKLFE